MPKIQSKKILEEEAKLMFQGSAKSSLYKNVCSW